MSKRQDKNQEKASPPTAAHQAADGEVAPPDTEEIVAETEAAATAPDEAAELDDGEAGPEAPVSADVHAALVAECADLREKWLRARAEMANLRKRTQRELVDSRRFAQADVLRSFLDIQDNLERALQSAGEADDTGALPAFKEGVELIYQRFHSLLQEKGVEPIPALDTAFDPTVHEAVGQMAREGVAAGQVIEVAQAGFIFGDLVLRPARVIISA